MAGIILGGVKNAAAEGLLRLAQTQGIIRLVKGGSGDKFTKHITDIGRTRLRAIPNISVDALKSSKGIPKNALSNIVQSIGDETDIEKALAKLSTKEISTLLKSNNVALTLSPEEFPEELLHLGYKPIPGYDYNKSIEQLKRVYIDPETGQPTRLMDRPEVGAAFQDNWLATHNLWQNPSSPTYNRIVGLEADPVKADKLLRKAQQEAAGFYPQYENDIVTQLGGRSSGLSRRLWTAIRGPLSKSTMPIAEQKHALNMAERPDYMFDTHKIKFQGVNDYDRFGPNVSRMGKDSTLHAIETVISPIDAFSNPKLLQGRGDVVKMGSYIRNILNRARRYDLPGVEGKQFAVTMDSNHNYAGLGGLRPMGTANDALTNDQEVYNFLSGLTIEAANRAGYGAAPADFQASVWAPIRELLEQQTTGFTPIGREINFAPEWEAALSTKNRDVQPLYDTAKKSFDTRYEDELAKAVATGDVEEIAGATSRLNAGRERLENMKKINPDLKALIALMGVGAAGYGASQRKEPNNMSAINRMRGM